jgi:hypothetical protein
LNGEVEQSSYLFLEERNVHCRAIGKVGEKIDDAKSTTTVSIRTPTQQDNGQVSVDRTKKKATKYT